MTRDRGGVRGRLVSVWWFLLALVVSVSVQAHGVLRVAIHEEPFTLDLHVGTSMMVVEAAIYEGLVTMDLDMGIKPLLAHSWEQIGDATYRFHLREGVRFHSGNPLNAEAVKAHYDRLLDPANPGAQAGYVGMIERVDVVDEFTVDFALRSSTGDFLFRMSTPHLAVQDVAEVERIGAELFGVQPSGTGPFRLAEWRRNQEFILEANPDYWQEGKPKVDRLEIRIVPEATPRIMALQTGEVDIIRGIPPESVSQIQATRGLAVVSAPALRTGTFLINMRDELMVDPVIRRAVAHAVDMNVVAEAILGPAGEAAIGFSPRGAFGALDLPYEHDPELTWALLEAAGWARNREGIFAKDGKTLTLTAGVSNAFEHAVAFSEAVQMELRAAGIDLQIAVRDHASMIAEMTEARTNDTPLPYSMFYWAFGVRTGDAGFGLQPTFGKGGLRNAGHYFNAQFQALLDVALQGFPVDVRRHAYHEAIRVLHADVAGIPLFTPHRVDGISARVTGYVMHPAELYAWGDVGIAD